MTTFEGPPLDDARRASAPLTLGGFLDEVADRFGPTRGARLRRPAARRRDRPVDLRRPRATRPAASAAACSPPASSRATRVGILMGNRPEAVAALFGAALAGAVAVPMSTFAPPPELAYMLEPGRGRASSSPRTACSPAASATTLARARARPARPCATSPSLGTSSWDALPRRRRRASPTPRSTDGSPPSRPTTTALVIFSSGTTSEPEGHAPRPPRARPCSSGCRPQLFGRHEGTRMWTALPMFWTAGLNTAMGADARRRRLLGDAGDVRARRGARPSWRGSGSPSRTRSPTRPPRSPSTPTGPTTDLSSLRCVYGKSAFARHPTVHGDPTWMMPVGLRPVGDVRLLRRATASDTPREQHEGRASGRLLPGNELRVVDPDTGAALGAGEDGELAVKGPTLMQRYLGPHGRRVLRRRRLLPHRRRRLRRRRRRTCTSPGRRTEMIKTGGANVSPGRARGAAAGLPAGEAEPRRRRARRRGSTRSSSPASP